jgi:2-oxoglutarate dehydrogenase E2 component (dihydrolipoamide succinyltransferase)
MPTDVIMPQMGESIFEGTLTKWLKKPGERVQRDEPLFEISTDKVDAEIPAPASGVLKEVKVAEGTTVQVNTVVGVIDAEGAAAQTATPQVAAPAQRQAGGASVPSQTKPAAKAPEPAKTAATTKGGAASTDGPAKAPAKTNGGAAAAATDGGGPATDVIMPQMGESIFEGTLTKWLKQVGDKVTRDEPLFEISTDKVDAEIPAPASGVLREIKVPAGQTVQVNTVVGVIGGAGAGAPSAAKTAASVSQTAQQPSAGAKSSAPAADRKGEAARAGGDVTAQRAGEEETEIPTTLRGRAQVEPEARAQEQRALAQHPEQVIQFPAYDRTAEGQRIRSSPLVRRIARDNNINLGNVAGTGLGGRISKKDILDYVAQHGAGSSFAARPQAAQPSAAQSAQRATAQQIAPPQPAPMRAPAAGEPLAVGPDLPDEVQPLSIMRRKISEHMVASRRTSAHVHAMFEIDMSRIVKLRNSLRKDWEARYGAKLTFMPFFARAVIMALQKWPIVNSSMTEEALHFHKHVNLGIAVALENGLIVPVVKHCEERSFVGLQRAITDVGERARAKKLKPEDVQGSTFTITNPGQFGAVFGLPIINQPNVAILGVGGITKTPLVLTDPEGNDYIAIRSVVHLTLGYDHRVIDGAVADQFMAQVKKNLEGWNEEIG